MSINKQAGSKTDLVEGESGLVFHAAVVAPKRISCLLIIASYTQQPMTTTGGMYVCL